jgi:hypothetical protein
LERADYGLSTRALLVIGKVSTRRKAGDVVYKIENAGFSGQPGLGMIRPDSEPDPCMLYPGSNCDDPDCQEWPDVWALGEDGKPTGENWCHVSECEMLDAPSREAE